MASISFHQVLVHTPALIQEVHFISALAYNVCAMSSPVKDNCDVL